MALEFDGTTQYISIAQTKDLPIYNEITYSVCGWVKIFGGQVAKRWFAERSTSDADPSFLIGSGTTNYENKVRIFIENDAAAILLATNSTTTVCDDTWHHFCWVDNNGDADLYIDGVLDATNFNYTRSGTFTLNTTTIGAALGTTLDFLVKGQLSDFRCYNRCLSANEISEIYHKRGADRVWHGLVGRWRMDELSGGTTMPNYLDTLVPIMTDNNAPSGAASASTESGSNWKAFKAFDSVTSGSNWAASAKSGWVKYDFGSGNGKVVKCYMIQSIHSEVTANPKSWTFQGSNNDSTWDTLDTQNNITSWPTNGPSFLVFPINNTTQYRYYRLNVSANNGYIVLHVRNLQLLDYSPAYLIRDLSGNGNHGTPYHAPIYRDSPHRLRRGVIIT